MSTKNESGILTTGDVLVDGVLRGLHQSQQSATDIFRALSKAVVWCSMNEAEDETANMQQAREWMRNAAMTFEREWKLAQTGEQQDV